MSTKKIPMVVHYSFDQKVPVWLYDTEEEAVAELRKQFKTELQEAKWNDSIRIESYISDDGFYAIIKEYFDAHTDLTEWTIGNVKN